MTLHHQHHLPSAAPSEIQFGIIPIRHSLSHNDKVAGNAAWTSGFECRLRDNSLFLFSDCAEAPRIFVAWGGASRARFGECDLQFGAETANEGRSEPVSSLDPFAQQSQTRRQFPSASSSSAAVLMLGHRNRRSRNGNGMGRGIRGRETPPSSDAPFTHHLRIGFGRLLSSFIFVLRTHQDCCSNGSTVGYSSRDQVIHEIKHGNVPRPRQCRMTMSKRGLEIGRRILGTTSLD